MAVLGPIYFSTLSWPVLFMKIVTYIHSEREREKERERETEKDKTCSPKAVNACTTALHIGFNNS
jgi:hypothetical protein